ncbi:MAG: hypothetical protein Q7K42_05660 [Candidatus Diapherotrites archaeon]|nr:hypothetical protein [Candidatus Diapherotrites archaeon]
MKYFVFLALLVVFFSIVGAQTYSNSQFYSPAFFQGDLCGNNKCDIGENQCTCAKDCGVCSGSLTGSVCRQLECKSNVCTAIDTPLCCGNNVCELGENYDSCAIDCKPKEIFIELVEELEAFRKGDVALLKVRVFDEKQNNISGLKLFAKGFFGSILLFDDGKNNDEKRNDGIYANTLNISSDLKLQKYSVFLTTEFLGVNGSKEIELKINPKLDANVFGLKENYFLGDNIDLEFIVRNKDVPVKIPLIVSMVGADVPVLRQEIFSDSEGKAKLSYHTSFIDKTGPWQVSLTGIDDFNNFVNFGTFFYVASQEATEIISISISNDLTKPFKRGEKIPFEVVLTDSQKSFVSEADVQVVYPGGKKISLVELEPGHYSSELFLDYDLNYGSNNFQIVSKKFSENFAFEGGKNFSFEVEKANFLISLAEPRELYYSVGDFLPVRIILTYPNNDLVVLPEILVYINQGQITLVPKRPGEYSAELYLDKNFLGNNVLKIEAEDQFGNFGFVEKKFIVSGENVFYTIQKNLPQIVLVLVIVLVIFLVGSKFLGKTHRLGYLKKRKEELEKLIQQANTDYFENPILKKKDYAALLDEYKKELTSVNDELRLWSK